MTGKLFPGKLWFARICAAIVIASEPAFAGTPAELCLAANRYISLGAPLPRTADRLKSSSALLIVAMGSSSTVGLWTLRPSATYPEMMRQELARLRPNTEIKIVNSGRIGDTISDNIARFERDVFAHTPDLVVWQLGTNDVAWGGHPDAQLKNSVVQAVRMLKARGVDVVLMDLQYAPKVLASPYYPKMQQIIFEVAREEKIGLFSRFELMRLSIGAGVAQNLLVSWDALHNSAEGYQCIGQALARSIISNIKH